MKFIHFAKILFLSSFVLAFSIVKSQTQYTLYEEDFEGATFNMLLNSADTFGNTGNNIWVVNDVYNGGGTYPNTIQQNVTSGGSITNAPTGRYLHIYNSSSAITNANYNTSAASDKIAVTTGICTNGFSNVKLGFFWLGDGSLNDHVEIYYSKNFGGWTQAPAGAPSGLTQYDGNNSLWQEETITDPNFGGADNLRFLFRWTNDPSGGANRISFAVDDISVVGEDASTATITASVASDSICIGSGGGLGFEISERLCSGTYQLWMDDNPGFTSPTQIGFPSIGTFQTGSGVWNINISFPPGTTPGCYYFRIDRLDQPAITGIVSGCVVAYDCPVTGVTAVPGKPLTLTHPPYPNDTTCRGSVMNMNFLSFGTFNVGNQYILEGDTTDNFNSPLLREVGRITDPNQYPSPLSPGSVGGLVPEDWPPGCDYRFRIRSTNPPAIFTIDGNYCVKACPIRTNDNNPVEVCVSDTVGSSITIPFIIDTTDNGVTFSPPNEFQAQLLDPMFFTIINTGVIGVEVDTASGTMTLNFPSGFDLSTVGLGPGSFFLRIISTNPSDPNNAHGTIVNLTVGHYIDNQTITKSIFNGFDYICANIANGQFSVFPVPNRFMQGSIYNYTFNGAPWVDGLPGGVTPIYNGPPGDIEICVQEVNNGCPGPWVCDTTLAIGPPDVMFEFPDPICEGQPQLFELDFAEGATYSWYIDDTLQPFSSHLAYLEFPEADETYTVRVVASNACGSGQFQRNVQVVSAPEIEITPDTFICYGESVKLEFLSGPEFGRYTWWEDSLFIAETKNITVTPDVTTVYWGKLDNAVGPEECDYNHQRMTVSVSPQLIVDSIVTICIGESININAYNGHIYTWIDPTNTLNDTTLESPIATPEITTTYTVIIEDTVYGCSVDEEVTVNVLDSMAEELILCHLEEREISAPDGGMSYNWSTGDTTKTIVVVGDNNNPDYAVFVDMVGPNNCTTTKTYYIETTEECDPIYYIPNAFSPNNNGNNDFLSIRSERLADGWKLHIYERRGNKIYEGQNWDGNFKGKPINGVVVVRLEAESLYKFNEANIVDPNGKAKVISEIQNVSIIR